jgi:hypothetical protein
MPTENNIIAIIEALRAAQDEVLGPVSAVLTVTRAKLFVFKKGPAPLNQAARGAADGG